MKRQPFMVQDPAMAAISARIGELIERVDQLIAQPDSNAEAELIEDIHAMRRDLDAELIARNPPPGWDVLESRAEQFRQ